MLLGSDYTTGVRGVGIVNATEIMEAFPGPDGLERFAAWMHSVGACTCWVALQRCTPPPNQCRWCRYRAPCFHRR